MRIGPTGAFMVTPLEGFDMRPSHGTNSSPVVTAVGVLVAIVAVVGTQFLDWQWGSNQLLPTAVGVLVAGIAVVVIVRNYRG